jgi:hypothetical protein
LRRQGGDRAAAAPAAAEAATPLAAGKQQRQQRAATSGSAHHITVWAIVGFMVLGLGDIALPGLLLAYAMRVDLDFKAAQAQAAVAAAAAAVPAGAAGAVDKQGEDAGGDASSTIAVAPELATDDGPTTGATPKASCFGLIAGMCRAAVGVFTTPGYFRTGVLGYALGLVFTLFISRTFHAAQPALLYLVPSTLLPLLWRAWRQGPRDFAAVWHGTGFVQQPRDTAE